MDLRPFNDHVPMYRCFDCEEAVEEKDIMWYYWKRDWRVFCHDCFYKYPTDDHDQEETAQEERAMPDVAKVKTVEVPDTTKAETASSTNEAGTTEAGKGECFYCRHHEAVDPCPDCQRLVCDECFILVERKRLPCKLCWYGKITKIRERDASAHRRRQQRRVPT